MKKKMFNEINKANKKVMLSSVIKSISKFMISEEVVNSIVNTIDLDKEYNIIILSDYNEFAKVARNYSDILEHSWAGERIYEESIKIIYDKDNDLKIGQYKQYCYSHNGNCREDDPISIDADFNITSTYCIIKELHTSDHYNGNNQESMEYKLFIYIHSINKEIEQNKIKERIKDSLRVMCRENDVDFILLFDNESSWSINGQDGNKPNINDLTEFKNKFII